MRKILLFTPPYHTGIIEITGSWPPVGLLYVAEAVKKAGFEVQVYDLMSKGHDCSKLIKYVQEWQPDVVMTGSFTPSIKAAVKCLKAVKNYNPKILTVLGGIQATFDYENLLRDNTNFIDYIVIGEGEETCPELLTAIKEGYNISQIKGLARWDGDKVVTTEERPLLENLDAYMPAWDLLDWSDYNYRITNSRLAVINTSRGCNHNCRFCSQHLFWRGCYRTRSPQAVVDEIMMLKNSYGVQMCMIADEYPTFHQNRWEEILDRLIVQGSDVYITLETRAEDIIRDADILTKYRQAGVIHVYVGVESVDQANLDYLGKGLKAQQGREAIRLLNEAGIVTECSFILGAPDETPEHIDATLQQAMSYNPDLAHFLLLTPWPYTDLYREVSDFIIEEDLSKYHFVHPIIKPQSMSVEDLWDKLVSCFEVFYSNKARNIGSYKDPFKRRYMGRCLDIMYNEFFKLHFNKSENNKSLKMG